MGDSHRGRQRARDTRGRPDGDHPQPGPRPSRRPRATGLAAGHVNRALCRRYNAGHEGFVTAFYGVFDPARRTLNYACAGHNPPRLKRCGESPVHSLDEIGGPPLGVIDDLEYDETTLTLEPDDTLAFYTDGITEAMDDAESSSASSGSTRSSAGATSMRPGSSVPWSRRSTGLPTADPPPTTGPCSSLSSKGSGA